MTRTSPSARPAKSRDRAGTRGVAAVRGSKLALRAVGVAGTVGWFAGTRLPRPAWHRRTAGADPVDEVATVVSDCLWRLGPVFVKLGQSLSTRPDLLDPRVCARLRSSLALGERRAPTDDTATLVSRGSVADVHRVRRHGQDLAVKVVRPGVARSLALDLALVEGAARLAARLHRSLADLPPIVEGLCGTVRQQVDLAAERERLVSLSMLEASCDLVVPRPVPELCTSGRLVMTWLPDQLAVPTARPAVGRELMRAVFEMLFITGTVHCDLHPGNWWVLPDGRLAIIDAGFAYSLDGDMREHFAEFFLGMATNNGDLCATHALAVAVRPVPRAAERAFRSELAELVRRVHGTTTAEFDLAAFVYDFFAIQRRHGAISDPAFVLPIVALLAVEGQVRALDPHLNFQAVAMPVLLRSLLSR